MIQESGVLDRGFGMRSRLFVLVGLALVAGLLFAIGSAPASTPPAGTVTVPSSGGGTASDNWTGTIPPGSNPTSACTGLNPVTEDEHDIQINAPDYSTVSATFTFQITWTPGTPTEDTADEILTVIGPDGNEVGSSDGSSTTETVIATNLPTGLYRVLACGFVNTLPQPYNGSLVVKTTSAAGEASLPSAPAQGLQFSAAVPSDNQRDEAEPLMEIDQAGNIYTCGPTGFSNLSDYAQVSTDGGDQFHLLGTPPRGQQGAGGGGDCGLATGVATNPQGNYQYAYTGLGPLTGFVTSTSPNNGHSIATGGPFGNGVTDTGGGADRQWMTFIDDKTVLLAYNQQVPRNVVVQKSTDGGLTYGPDAKIAGANPRFPGPLRYDKAHNLVFFAWDRGNADGTDNVNLSVSHDGGTTWQSCRAAVAPAATAGFTVADNDSAGNIYIAYAEKQRYHTYLVSLAASNVSKCNQPVSQSLLTTGAQPTVNPGFSAPVQVDRDAVRTTVFPWLVAGGAPGRVAVTFYGTTQDGDPNNGTFKAAWDVYVNQSLNALDPTAATFSQVKATTHPFHYDSICLNGLGCDTSGGDRSLADFFAIDLNPVTNKLSVVFNRAEKKPDESQGHVATPMVFNQIGGPANTGATLPSPTRLPLRTSSTDPAGDALSSYSLLGVGVPPPAPPTKNEAAGDFLNVSVGPEVDFHTGQTFANGGFTVTMKLASLSAAALQAELTDTASQSLLWVFRFVNGYQVSAASARWNPVQGFTYGYNDYRTGVNPCASSPVNEDKCVLYPGDTPIQGKVDQSAGTIALSVPRGLLRALGTNDPFGRPTEVPATVGSRFYDATAFSLGNNASATQDAQTFLYPLDNDPAMDFLLPAAGTTGAGGGGGGGGTSKGGCQINGGGSIVGTGTDGKFSVDAHESGQGNVYYRDPGANVDFRSTGKVTVTCTLNSAQIKGTGVNNMTGTGTFTVNVVDNGEPGTTDTFSITLTNPSYSRSGTLIRGNIQVKQKA